MSRIKAALIASAALFLAGPAFAQEIQGGGELAAGNSGQFQINLNNQFAGLTLGGDITAVNTGTGAVTVSTVGGGLTPATIPSAPTTGNCVQWASATTLGQAAAPCGSGGGASLTAPNAWTPNGAASTSAEIFTGTLFTGGSGTTTFPYIYINQGAAPTTFSTNGVEWGINAPSGFAGNFIELHVNGGASVFNIGSSGTVTTSSGYTAGAGSTFGWTGRGLLSSKAAGSVQLGNTDTAAPVAQTLSVQSVVAGTSNTAGANFVIQGSLGTGTGLGGLVTITTSPAGTTGTAQNAGVAALVADTTQFVILGNGTPTCGTGCASIAAGATNQRMLVTAGSAVTSVAVNFSKTLTTAPICTANEVAATPVAVGFSAAPTTAGFTLTLASAITGNVVAVHCE